MSKSNLIRYFVTAIIFMQVVSLLIVLNVKGQEEESWNSLASMQSETYFLGAASIDDKIYAIGGHFFKPDFNTTTVYNPKTDTWTTKSPVITRMPNSSLSISNLCVVSCQNKIYAIGGMEDVGTVTNTIRVYNPLTDMWEIKSSILIQRSEAVAATVKDKIYITGGFSGGPLSYYEIYNVTEVYDPLTNTLSTKAPIPTAVRGASIAVSDNKIFVFGGVTHEDYACNLTQIYNPESDSWSLGSQIPTGASYACAGATSGKLAPRRIYIFGGSTEPNISLNLTQIYDPEKDSWSKGAPMNNGRLGLAVAVIDDLLYTLGGYEMTSNSGVRVLSNNDLYTPLGYNHEIPVPEPDFQTALILVSFIIISIIGLGTLVYFKKYKSSHNGISQNQRYTVFYEITWT